MNTLNTVVLHNKKRGTNQMVARIIAEHLGCHTVAAEDSPDLSEFDRIVLVIPNAGDEELPQPMEDFLLNLAVENKHYYICELGNYFGFENYGGCKNIAFKILDSLGWVKISDVSLDSLPLLDEMSLRLWLETVQR